MSTHRIFTTAFSSVYPHYVQKAERKQRTRETGFQPFEIGTDDVTGTMRTDGVNQVVIYELSTRGR